MSTVLRYAVAGQPDQAVSRLNPLPTGATGADGTNAASVSNPAPTRNVGSTGSSRIVSAAASTNATVAKASTGTLGLVTGYNANAAPRYLKFYNKATAPTVGTDVPVWSEYLAPQSKFSIAFAGMYFSAGLSYAMTTGGADNDTGALTAADVLNLNVAFS